MRFISRNLLITMLAVACAIVCVPVLHAQDAAKSLSNPDDVYWDTSLWSSSDYSATAFATYNGKLIAGGMYENGIGAWDGSSWSVLGPGFLHGFKVGSLAVYGDKLFAGGSFRAIEGDSAAYIASWDGSSWSTEGSSGMDYVVDCLEACGGRLIVGGSFSIVNGTFANCIAAWNGSAWSAFGSGMTAAVLAITEYDGKLIAGGAFTTAGDDTAAYHIAAWNGSSWEHLGSGVDNNVLALATYGGKLYAGGSFRIAGGDSACAIAVWDGSSWSPLGSGMGGYYPVVNALTVYDGKLIVGGNFTTAGGDTATYIAAWDGSSWSSLGSGVDGSVEALALHDDKLVVAGVFWAAGEKYGNIAYWTKKTTVVSEESALPATLKIYPNVPNPFNPSTTLHFETPQTLSVRVAMYDILGQEVRVLHDGMMHAGSHSLVWDGKNDAGKMAASGVYFYTVKAGANVAKGKVMFLR